MEMGIIISQIFCHVIMSFPGLCVLQEVPGDVFFADLRFWRIRIRCCDLQRLDRPGPCEVSGQKGRERGFDSQLHSLCYGPGKKFVGFLFFCIRPDLNISYQPPYQMLLCSVR